MSDNVVEVDDLMAQIANGDIGAITIDASIFDANGLNLDGGLLKRLEQFKGSPVALVISDIVEMEVVSHLRKHAADSLAQATNAIKQVGKWWPLDDQQSAGFISSLKACGTPLSVCEGKMQAFKEHTGSVSIRAADWLSAGELIDRYFGVKPPFEASEKKKHEFPDAIALLSIEAWAKKNGKKVLAISADAGWAQFCHGSEWLICVKDLAEALSYFQKDAGFFASRISRQIAKDNFPALSKAIENAIENSVPEFTFYPEYASDFMAEDEIESVIVRGWRFDADQSGSVDVTPVEYDDDVLTFEVKVIVDVEVDVKFYFSMKDSIDKDYVSMGSGSASSAFSVGVDIIVSMSWGDGETPSIIDIEVVGDGGYVDFGYVEPDWMANSDEFV